MFSSHLQEYAFEKYQSRKKYYAPIWEELEHRIGECTPEEAVLMRFLYGTMPVRDAGEYDFDVFLSYVTHAVWLREHMEWCKELPEDVFVHHVMYYRINSEDISECRKFFYDQLKDRIAGMTMEDAVLEINYWCAENAVYESTDMRTASPMTMFRCGKGRCGEESTFAVTAYRSVGIPARQVYTPRWAHCDDNHAWVEVCIHGEWYFLGACEPESVLNKGWFSGPASRGILIHSRTFSDFVSDPKEECIGKEDLLIYYNNTSTYAKTDELYVTVKDSQGRPVEGAFVAMEILNMAEYYPAANLITDEKGQVHITVGLGDIRIRAWKDHLFAEVMASPQENLKVELQLGLSEEQLDWVSDEWESCELTAPEEYVMHPGKETKEQKERNAKRFEEANRMREQRFAAYYLEDRAADYPEEASMLRIAGENFTELFEFLTKDYNPDRKRMLHSLVDKDYKDLKAEILESHLDCEQNGLPEDIYVPYLLCPRVYVEELTPYKQYIRDYFTKEEKEAFVEKPDRIWQYIKEQIQYAPEVDYKTICATPVGCLKMKQGNPLAQRILFVAVCRSLGIPARMDRVTLKPQYWNGADFIVPESFLEDEKCSTEEKAVLQLQVEDGSKWNYFQTWTIGKLEGVKFTTLDYEGTSFQDNQLTLNLDPGIYRLITTLRMPNGNQHASQRVFQLAAGENKTVEMTLWETQVEDMLVDIRLEDFAVQDENGKEFMLSHLTDQKAMILAFLGVGAEPTEHVLNEMLAGVSHWNASGIQMLMILRDPAELKNATLRKVLDTVTGIQIYYDRQEHCEKVAKQMEIDPEKLPVLTVVENGLTGIYACSGYNVGSVDLMMKMIRRKEIE